MDAAPNVDTLTAALDYLRRGFSIFPLRPRSKQPAVAIKPYLDGAARMTAPEAEAYWREHPDAGVAIVTGAPSGVVVTDCDPRNGGNNEETRRDCPSELVAKTGGGGLHIFCRHPRGTVPCGKTSRPGVDRKGDGGYVVAAPSVHPDTGERYAWVNEGEPGALPEWVTDKPAPVQGTSDEPREHWIAETLAHPESAVPGTQNETLSRLCWWITKNHDRDIALSILSPWVAKLEPGRPHEPWTLEHLVAMLDRAYEKRALEPGAAGPIVDDTGTAVGGGDAGLARAIVALAGRLGTKEKPKREVTPEQAIAKVVIACRSAQARAQEQAPEVDWIAPHAGGERLRSKRHAR